MPIVGNKEHATGEAAKGMAGEDGYSHAEGKVPNKMTGSYGAGDTGTGPEIEDPGGGSSRTTPLKGTKGE